MMFFTVTAFSQVGIGTAQPHLSAVLDLTSSNKGFLPPRLSTSQRDSISVKPAGLMIYNTDENCMQYWNTTMWKGDCSDSGNPGTGIISSLDCTGATNTGSLVAGMAASGVSSSISYTGGNGGAHNGQTVSSTGVSGLTAILGSGSFANGSGTLVYTITGTPSGSGNASFAINIGGKSCTLTRSVSGAPGSISSLNCSGATHNGSLISGTAASNVKSIISYSGGNGGAHGGQTVTSTGVTGLTAKVSAGSFANGNGTLTYTITGTPSGKGIASFAINIGGKTCTLTRTVGGPVIKIGVNGAGPFPPSGTGEFEAFRTQLSNPTNYGPAGTYTKSSGYETTIMYDELTNDTGAQLKAKFDIINMTSSGYYIYEGTANRLKDFVNLGGVLIVTLDVDGNNYLDTLCNIFGISGNNIAGPSNTTASASSSNAFSSVFGDSRGVSLSVSGPSVKVTSSRLPSGSTLYATAADGSPAVWTLGGYNGRVIFVWAEGVFKSGSISGNLIDTAQERFLHNLMAYAIDKAKGF